MDIENKGIRCLGLIREFYV